QDVFNSFVTGPVGEPMPPTLEINRSTGTITLINQTAAVQIVGYTLTSAAGSLDPAAWLSVTDNYDANSGTPTFDPDNTWTELSAAGSKVDFSEFDFSTGGTAGGSLGTGGALTSLQLGGPGAWKKSIYEDLVMDVRLADGSALPVATRYIGALAFVRSDLNFDGLVNAADYNIFLTNNLADFTGLTAAETYPRGDLNGDLQNNRLDFRLFKTDYNIANGAGAFEALLASVPEPSTLVIVGLGLVALLGRRPFQSVGRTRHQARYFAMLFMLAAAFVAVSQGSVQAALRNRYSFNEGATADATGRTIVDSVSGANGTVIGPATGGALPTATATQLTLPGGASGTQPYVNLPNGLASSLTNATFEGWYTQTAPQNWARIFDFGSTTGGELAGPGGGGNGLDYIFYSASRGADTNTQRAGMRNFDPLFGPGGEAGTVAEAESLVDPNIAYTLGTQRHFAVVYNSTGGAGGTPASLTVFIDGIQRATTNTAIQLRHLNDVNNWLGRSNWTGDANFSGSLNEFRIYDTALTADDIAKNAFVGPDDFLTGGVMSIEVNTASGEVSLVNNLSRPLEVDYYEITSAGGALNTAGWTSIDGNTTQGAGWDKSPGSNANQLAELYLPEGGFSVPANGELPLGGAFSPGMPQDLQFRFDMPTGLSFVGSVDYTTSPGLPGDYNGNGRVDAADYVVWRKNPNAHGGDPAGYNTWRINFDRTSGSGAGSGAAVPEPAALSSLSCGALVLCAWIARKRRKGGNPMIAGVKCKACTWCTAFVFAMILVGQTVAGTPDRIYRMGDDPAELPTIGGTPNASFGAFTVDSQFLDNIAFSDASDLSYTGGPTYFDAGSGLLARPGAATGTFGLQFNGTSDLLFDTGGALGVPAQGDNLYVAGNGAPGYAGITTRYIEGWVRPTGGAGARRDIVNDSGRFSVFINTSNNWAILNGTTTVNSSTPAVLNTWTHVMHRTFGSGQGAALYVNGIAVAATNQGYATGDQAGAALDIIVGAGLNRTSNFFQGQLDEITIGVAGGNYGNFTLGTDNDYVRQNLTGVNPGDINRDGSVNTTDINTFIANWRRVQQVNGVTVGDLNSRLFGDLNMNGIVDIDDAYTLHAALRAGGSGAGLDFSLLGSIPEPGGALLVISALTALALRRQRK
ncbi:MAG TPA: LamG-like jellyroll fold domain-containing protein, partial [Lacipirellulaceae bacterium]|nr:LamG-like jellyroll fold domain-containing protein [Lacipirellulaceae bacterium]